ncbi:MAG: 50S ribosomal protein L24e [Nanoarchaeota archaeon]
MPVCSFCKKSYEIPRGMTIVQKDGTIKYFCSSKCRKNFEMGRDARKVKWVKKQKKIDEKK